MSGLKHRGVPLVDGDVEVLVEVPPPPKVVPRNKGLSKYPFDQVVVGGGMKVRRNLATVRSAAKTWARNHKGQRFQCWRSRDERGEFVMVKRLK